MKQITVDEATARAILSALELSMRVGMGQLEYLEEVIRTEQFASDNWTKNYDVRQASGSLMNLKKEVFGHPAGGSYAIRDMKIPDTFRSCAEVMFALRASMGDERFSSLPSLLNRKATVKVVDVGDE